MNRGTAVFIARNGKILDAVCTGRTCTLGKLHFLLYGKHADMTLTTIEKTDYIALNPGQQLPPVIYTLLTFVVAKPDGTVGWDFRGMQPYKGSYQAFVRVRANKKTPVKEILGSFPSAVLAALAHDVALERRGARLGYNFAFKQQREEIANFLQVEQDALVDDVAHKRLLAYDKFVGVELHPAAEADSIALLDPNKTPMLLGHVPEADDMEEDARDFGDQTGIRTPTPQTCPCASASASVTGSKAADTLDCRLDAASRSQVRLQLKLYPMDKQAEQKRQSVILQGRLGQGGEGSVWKAMQCSDALEDMSTGHVGEAFALKVARVCVQSGPVTGTMQQDWQQEEKQLQREFEYLQLGSCPHVVRTSGIGYLEGFQFAQQQSGHGHEKTCFEIPCLHLEFAPHGTLSDHINNAHSSRQNNQLGFTQQQTRQIVRQLALGIFHLHSKCLIHRDLKGENILVFDPPFGAVRDPLLHPEKLQYKISDFGTAFLKQGLATAPETFVGTRGCYMAPEMAKMENIEMHMTYGAAIDIWALGMLFLQIRFGTVPFFDLKADASANSGGKDIYLDYLKSSSCAYNMTLDWVGGPLTNVERKWLGGCLSVDASKRWSIRRLLIHEYLYEG